MQLLNERIYVTVSVFAFYLYRVAREYNNLQYLWLFRLYKMSHNQNVECRRSVNNTTCVSVFVGCTFLDPITSQFKAYSNGYIYAIIN